LKGVERVSGKTMEASDAYRGKGQEENSMMHARSKAAGMSIPERGDDLFFLFMVSCLGTLFGLFLSSASDFISYGLMYNL